MCIYVYVFIGLIFQSRVLTFDFGIWRNFEYRASYLLGQQCVFVFDLLSDQNQAAEPNLLEWITFY